MKTTISRHIVLLALAVVVIFAVFLYLQMCTASLYEDYQDGIARVRILHPGLLVLMILLLTVIVPGKRGEEMALFSVQFTKLGIWLCIGFGILYVVVESIHFKSQWSFPRGRTLAETIATSLSHPNFSSRSLAVLIYTALLLFFLRWRAKLILRKRHMEIRADGPTSGTNDK
jgi:hypothetical protein